MPCIAIDGFLKIVGYCTSEIWRMEWRMDSCMGDVLKH